MPPELQSIPVTCLQAGQYQPRQDFNEEAINELAQSIATHGLIEPLLVRSIAKDRYEIIAGERRWRAAERAGLETIPCLVGEYTDEQACTLGLVENIQRQDLNLIEEAAAYRRLLDEFHYQQDEIAVLVGKSRSHIANLVRLLTLVQPVQALVANQQLAMGHARTLVGLGVEQQIAFAGQVVQEQWSVRQLEEAIKALKNKSIQVNAHASGPKDKEIERLQMYLAEQVGAPVQIISDDAAGGWLQVKFFDNDTLAGLLDRLGLSYDT